MLHGRPVALFLLVALASSLAAPVLAAEGTVLNTPVLKVIEYGQRERIILPVSLGDKFVVVSLLYDFGEGRVVERKIIYNTTERVLAAAYNPLSDRLYVLFENSLVAYSASRPDNYAWKLELEQSLVGDIWMYTVRSGAVDYVVISTMNNIVDQGRIIVIADEADHGVVTANIGGTKSRAAVFESHGVGYIIYGALKLPGNWTLVVRSLETPATRVVAEIPMSGRVVGITVEGKGRNIVVSSSEGAIYRIKDLVLTRYTFIKYRVGVDVDISSNPVLLRLGGRDYIYVGTEGGEIVRLAVSSENGTVFSVEREKVSSSPVTALGYIDLVPDVAEHYVIAYAGGRVYAVNSKLRIKASNTTLGAEPRAYLGLGRRQIYLVTDKDVFLIAALSAAKPVMTRIWSVGDLAPSQPQPQPVEAGSALLLVLVVVAVAIAGVFAALKIISRRRGVGGKQGGGEAGEEELGEIDVGI